MSTPNGPQGPYRPHPGPQPQQQWGPGQHQQWQQGPPQQPPPAKKKHTGCKIAGGIIGGFILLSGVGGAIGAINTDTPAATSAPTAAAPQTSAPAPAEPTSAPTPAPAPAPESTVESDPNYLTYSVFEMSYEVVGYPLESVDTGDPCIKAGAVTDGYMANGAVVFECGFDGMDSYVSLFEDELTSDGGEWFVIREANWAHYSTDKQFLTEWAAGFGAGTVEAV